MLVKLSVLVAATAVASTLALGGTALAGEGNGDPFPTPDVGITHVITKPVFTMGGTAPYNYYQPGRTVRMSDSTAAAGVPFGVAGVVMQHAPSATATATTRPSPANVAAVPGSSHHG